jgi:ABC-type multidrug transport system ATPase subunit
MTVETTGIILEAVNLSKSYGTAYQLGPLDLTLTAGETVALMGPNGAGKTTLFQLLTGMTDASTGEIRLLGKRLTPDTPLVKRLVGYLPQNHYLPRWVSGIDILNYGASLYGFTDGPARVKKAMQYWDCASYAHKPLASCSHGMKKRVALALAILHDPVALFLDEPYSGLDLYHIKSLDEVILARQKAGQVTILSTHVAPYAARLCNRALVLKKGQLTTLAPGDQTHSWTKANLLTRIEMIASAFFSPSHVDHSDHLDQGQ